MGIVKRGQRVAKLSESKSDADGTRRFSRAVGVCRDQIETFNRLKFSRARRPPLQEVSGPAAIPEPKGIPQRVFGQPS